MIMSDDFMFAIAIAKAATIVVSAAGLLIYLAWSATKHSSAGHNRQRPRWRLTIHGGTATSDRISTPDLSA